MGAAGDGETRQHSTSLQQEAQGLSKAQRQRLSAKERKQLRETAKHVVAKPKMPKPNAITNKMKLNKLHLEKKVEEKTAEAEGGYFLQKTDFDQAIQENKDRRCLEDALANAKKDVFQKFGEPINMFAIYARCDNTRNTRFEEVKKLLPSGLDLVRSSARFMKKGGPELWLLKTYEGLYIVQLSIILDNKDKKPDLHCVYYNAEGIPSIEHFAQKRLVKRCHISF